MSLEESIYGRSPSWMRDLLMTAHGFRIKRHRFGAPMVAIAKEFQSLSTSSSEEIERFQLKRLVAIVDAAKQSSYYRKLLTEVDIDSTDEMSLADLRRIPLLTKDLLRSELSGILTSARVERGWLHGHTSGTTGSPLSLWYDRRTCQATNAADLLQKQWAGVKAHEWVALLLGRQVSPQRQSEPPFWQRNFALKQMWFSSLHMSSENLPSYVQQIRTSGIRYLEGYPSTLYVLARHLLDRSKTLPLKAVFCSSETLLDLQRDAIQAAFQAPLYDFFGHAERVIFAIECSEHSGKHLVEPYGLTEVVDEAGQSVPDGHFGYLVGTSLFNSAMPLLRYRTNDISAIDRSPCPCGSNFRKIVDVSTKAEDIVFLPDGRWLSPSALTHPFKPFPQISESQIVQESIGRIVISIVAGEQFSEQHEADLRIGLCARLGTGVSVEILRVKHIPRERSGKFRWVISKVQNQLSLDWSRSSENSLPAN